MQIIPLVNSSGINGNIGQCEIKTSHIKCATKNLFICKDVQYATNSCTNETNIYHSWHFTDTSIMGALFFISAIFVLIMIKAKIIILKE